MAAELILFPVLGLLALGWAIFFGAAALYREQQRAEAFDRLRARWQGTFATAHGHRLALHWHAHEGWVATFAEPGSTATVHFRAALLNDTMTVTLSASGVGLDLRYLEEGVLVSPLVPGLHGDIEIEPGWMQVLLQGATPRWTRM